ncbi:GNAT family N-acetyltransferase [Streptacidiphilus sp. PB12-B1b]|uniref:GNAT family N-acetyltransferase n=1 Tax=Streptacidiphilus sp. PB12-B1b TaxID=2705012 RepID=UPI0015FA79FC|nr:GNAT family N-acetyltransferase [Streptacidiphilus sp. PB12-B1b]QMU79602.1 GNAT family N-acetyltransferase [Streptacidiphilus sp. PB12-B1b]
MATTTPGGRHDGGSGDSGGIEIRAVEEADLADWGRAVSSGFLAPKGHSRLEIRQAQFSPGRTLGAYHRRRCVGTFRSLDRELTVPGGATLTADGITNVTVAATHRRRGLLTRMMTRGLTAAAERGNSLAILIAAEYPIYGRYGFGPATGFRSYTVDKLRAGNVRVPAEADDGSFELLDLDEWRAIGPELYDRFRLTQPGAISRLPLDWRLKTGGLIRSPSDWKEPLVALYRDGAGQPAGYVAYRVTEEWTNKVSATELIVTDLIAVDRTAAAALWRYLLAIDWVVRIRIDNAAPDEPLALLFDNPRACTDGGNSCDDFMWLRILDAPTAFAARSYDAPGRVVLQVADALGYVDGRFALETAPDGTGRWTAADAGEPTELALDAGVLATLYLGTDTATRLHAAGRLTELRPGAAHRLSALLRTDFRPWCPDSF